jgi:hypothetical protein
MEDNSIDKGLDSNTSHKQCNKSLYAVSSLSIEYSSTFVVAPIPYLFILQKLVLIRYMYYIQPSDGAPVDAAKSAKE